MAKSPTQNLRSLLGANIKVVPPMLALAVAVLPEGPDFQYETDLDGYRTIVVKTDHTAVFSRRGHDISRRFLTIASDFADLPYETILDGGVVAFDDEGRPNFNALQNARRGHLICFYAFDLLAYRGKNPINLPLSARRAMLEKAIADLEDPIRLSPAFPFRPLEIVRAAREQKLEGAVARKLDSRYERGQRSGCQLPWRAPIVKGQLPISIAAYQPGLRKHLSTRFQDTTSGFLHYGAVSVGRFFCLSMLFPGDQHLDLGAHG